MLTAAIRVQTEAKPDVGAVVFGENGAAGVAVVERARRRVGGALLVIELDVELFEAVRRVGARPAAREVDRAHDLGVLLFLRLQASAPTGPCRSLRPTATRRTGRRAGSSSSPDGCGSR